ncbi:helix-turn-helix transcriptional regulator [bacterium]|nr:helix-turn-helix transcriptional regulator [bacterium]
MGNLRELFGKRLRSIRLTKGLTQEGLAEKAGLHSTYIGIIERGKQSASLDTIEKLADALGVEEDTFFSFASRQSSIGEKEGLIIGLENILRKQKTENIKKISQICDIFLSEKALNPLPMVADKKAKYGKR